MSKELREIAFDRIRLILYYIRIDVVRPQVCSSMNDYHYGVRHRKRRDLPVIGSNVNKYY